MQVTVDIPDEFADRAAARGMGVEAYLRGLIEADQSLAGDGLRRLGPGPYTPQEAGRWIRAIRAENRLDGVTIRELIDEGRKY
jgi:hypothetical protein